MRKLNSLWASAALVALPSLALAVPGGAPSGPMHERVGQNDFGKTTSAWHPLSLRHAGTSLVTWDQPDDGGGQCSLEQVIPWPGAPEYVTTLEILSPDTILLPGEGLKSWMGFGRLADLQTAAFSWYRHSSSTTYPWLSTALRLIVFDPDMGVNGSSWELVWEAVYNGYSPPLGVPTNQWIRSDVTNGFFWRRPLYLDGIAAPYGYCSQNRPDCHRYDRNPQQWGFGPNTVVIGVSLSAGGGWGGTYWGFTDRVELQFTGGDHYLWDFEN